MQHWVYFQLILYSKSNLQIFTNQGLKNNLKILANYGFYLTICTDQYRWYGKERQLYIRHTATYYHIISLSCECNLKCIVSLVPCNASMFSYANTVHNRYYMTFFCC